MKRKFTDEEVMRLRKEYDGDLTQNSGPYNISQFAKKYGVSRWTMTDLIYGLNSYSHLPID